MSNWVNVQDNCIWKTIVFVNSKKTLKAGQPYKVAQRCQIILSQNIHPPVYVNTIKCIIFRKNFQKIIMTSIVILWYWHYFPKIRTVKMKRIFFHRFDIAVLAEPWELKNTSICQLWHVGRLRVKYRLGKSVNFNPN